MATSDVTRTVLSAEEFLAQVKRGYWSVASGIRRLRRRRAHGIWMEGDALRMRVSGRLFFITDFSFARLNEWTLEIQGMVVRRPDKGRESPKTARTLTLRDEQLYKAHRQRRQAHLYAQECRTVQEQSVLLERGEDRQECRDLGYRWQPGDEFARPHLTGPELVHVLGSGGWTASHHYRYRRLSALLPQGEILTSYDLASGCHARTAEGNIRLDEFKIVQIAPWRFHLRQITHVRQTRPRRMGGGYRHVPVYVTVLELRNQDVRSRYGKRSDIRAGIVAESLQEAAAGTAETG